MLDFIIKHLRKHFGFSKSESNATLILLSLVVGLVIFRGTTLYLKSKQKPQEISSEEASYLESKLDDIPDKKDNQPKPVETQKQLNVGNTLGTATKNTTIIDSSVRPIKFIKKFSNYANNAKFDINTATPEQLKSVHGIGEVLSKRIVKFRDKLGGFLTTSQYKEVYGLQPDTVTELEKRSFLTPNYTPKKINVNTASIKGLVSHPYINYDYAKAIVKHREKNGVFKNVEDFTQFSQNFGFNYNKILPYLKFQE